MKLTCSANKKSDVPNKAPLFYSLFNVERFKERNELKKTKERSYEKLRASKDFFLRFAESESEVFGTQGHRIL